MNLLPKPLKRLFFCLFVEVSWVEVLAWSMVFWVLAILPRAEAAELQQWQANETYALAYGRAGIGIPERAPRIVPKIQADIAARYCGRPCAVRAALIDGEIWLDESMDMADTFNVSVLLHELVHYVQWARYGPATDCLDHRARELQAYAIQIYALERVGIYIARPEVPPCL